MTGGAIETVVGVLSVNFTVGDELQHAYVLAQEVAGGAGEASRVCAVGVGDAVCDDSVVRRENASVVLEVVAGVTVDANVQIALVSGAVGDVLHVTKSVVKEVPGQATQAHVGRKLVRFTVSDRLCTAFAVQNIVALGATFADILVGNVRNAVRQVLGRTGVGGKVVA